MAAITGRVVLSWICQLRLFTRAAALGERSIATLGSLMPAVEEVEAYALEAERREPVQFGVGGVCASSTAAPRASLPRAAMP